MTTIEVATGAGLRRFEDDGTSLPTELDGRAITSLAPDRERVWAALDGSELWVRDEGNWTHRATLERPRATCLTVIDRTVFVGTSEAHLFRLFDDVLERIGSFDAIEGHGGWYTPWGGPPDTRSMANWDEDMYVNVHVGGIPRSSDGGSTWMPTIDVDADVHHVTTTEHLVIAACAGGVAVSRDHGETWTNRTDGFDSRYSRAVAVCGDVLLASASRGPRGGDAAVYRGGLERGPFERCRDGLPEAFDGNIDTYRLDALRLGHVAAFGTEDGRAFVSHDAGSSWEKLGDGLPPISRVLVLP